MADTVFIALFRGINVGGRAAKMETLRNVLAKAGFGNVATYIQSGNVVLTSERKAADVAAAIEEVFAETFGFSSRVSLRSAAEWKRLVAHNPFPEAEHKRLHAIIVDGEPAADAADRLTALATPTERFVFGEGVLYLHTPDGFGVSKLAEALDKVLKVPLTARNWRTVLTLMDMAEKAAKQA